MILKQVATHTLKVNHKNKDYGVVTNDLREIRVEDYQRLRTTFSNSNTNKELRNNLREIKFEVIELEKSATPQ